MNILKKACRPTTRQCYAAKWKHFVMFCHKQNVNPFQAKVQTLILYLLHLQTAGLPYTAIILHLAAIAAYLQNRQHISVFKIPVIKAFMEGLKRIIPPRLPPAPAWNVNIVLTRLMGPPFKPLHSCQLQYLSWTLAILIAITSLRRVSEIQALTLEEPFFQLHRDRVVFRTNPKF